MSHYVKISFIVFLLYSVYDLLNLVLDWVKTYKYSSNLGNSEQSEKGLMHILGRSKNNSHSHAEETAHHLHGLTEEQWLINDTLTCE